MQKLDNNTVTLNGGRITTDRNGVSTYDNRSIYSQVTPKTVTNTTDETSFFNDTSCVGSRTIPANTISVGDIDIQCDIMITAIGNSGAAVCMGRTHLVGGSERSLIASTPVTINTAAPIVIDVTYAWGTGSTDNILKNVTGTIQLINL